MRHALATELLASGVALSDISQVLRHRDLDHDGDLRQGGLHVVAGRRARMAGSDPMSALSVTLNDYLSLRRGLGHQPASAARLLPRFVAG
jgi:hypothetical protein